MTFKSSQLYLVLLMALPAGAVPAPTLATPVLRLEAERGNPAAMARLGWLYYHGTGMAQDFQEALKWFRAAADKGDVSGLYGLSRCLRWGNGVAQDVDTGDRLMFEAAGKGDADAQVAAGETVIEQGEREQARRQARQWYEQAAAQGNSEGLRHLGFMVLHGQGGPADTTRGLALLRRSAAMGNGIATYYLAQAYERGNGVEKDLAQARALYRQAAERGDVDASSDLARLLERGLGGPRDIDQAMRLCEASALDGHAGAALALARLYSEASDSGRSDDARMVRWLTLAAELGDARALEWQGRLYSSGYLLPLDLRRAVEAFSRSAERGNQSGRYWLAVSLEEGRGVARDEARALQLYLQAGANLPLAKRRLAAMWLDGRGAPRNVEAVRALVDAGLAEGKPATMLELVAALVKPERMADVDPLVQRILQHPASVSARGEAGFMKAMGVLGEAYRAAGRLDSAESHLREQLALLGQLPAPSQADLADAWRQLGALFALKRQPEQADAAFVRSTQARLLASGKPDKAVADNYIAIASGYTLGDYFTQSERYRRLAFTLYEQLGQLDKMWGIDAAALLGSILHDQGKYREAASYLAQAVALQLSRFREDSLVHTSLLGTMGRNQLALGDVTAAEATFRRQLKLADQGGGNPNEERATALRLLGSVLARSGRVEEAQAMLQKALGIRALVPGKPSFAVAEDMHALGRIYLQTGHYRQADDLFGRALAVAEDHPSTAGWDAAWILHDMGLSQARQGKHADAARLLERAFAIRFDRQPAHHETAGTAAALAAAYRSQGRNEAAEALLQQVGDAAKDAASKSRAT